MDAGQTYKEFDRLEWFDIENRSCALQSEYCASKDTSKKMEGKKRQKQKKGRKKKGKEKERRNSAGPCSATLLYKLVSAVLVRGAYKAL